MNQKPEWPEEYPSVPKKKNARPRKWPLALKILLLGLILGIAVGLAASQLLPPRPLTIAPMTPTATPVPPRPTQLAEWTPDVPDQAQRPVPTMTPWRVQGEADTLFSVHLYQENFLGETAATQQVTFAQPTRSATLYEENGVTITHPAGADLFIEDMSSTIIGRELGSSGPEHFDIAFAEPVTAVGFYVQDNPNTGEFNNHQECAPRSSRFSITFKRNGQPLGTLPIPSSSAPIFMGVTASQPFDTIEIREDGAALIDDPAFCEVDYIGPIWTK